MPHRNLNRKTVNNLTRIFGCHKLTDDGQVSFAVPVHLAGSHVLKLGVIDQLLGNTLASDKHNTHQLNLWLIEAKNLTELFSEYFCAVLDAFFLPAGTSLRGDAVDDGNKRQLIFAIMFCT